MRPAALFLSSGDVLADRRYELAKAYAAEGDRAAAADLLMQTLERAPAFASAWFALGEIRAQGGDYRLAVKGNQPTLEAAVQAVLDRACEADFEGFRYDTHGSVESGHGRQEERYVTVIYDPEGLPAEFQFDAPLPIGSGSANAAAAPIFSRHSRPFLVHREVRFANPPFGFAAANVSTSTAREIPCAHDDGSAGRSWECWQSWSCSRAAGRHTPASWRRSISTEDLRLVSAQLVPSATPSRRINP